MNFRDSPDPLNGLGIPGNIWFCRFAATYIPIYPYIPALPLENVCSAERETVSYSLQKLSTFVHAGQDMKLMKPMTWIQFGDALNVMTGVFADEIIIFVVANILYTIVAIKIIDFLDIYSSTIENVTAEIQKETLVIM